MLLLAHPKPLVVEISSVNELTHLHAGIDRLTAHVPEGDERCSGVNIGALFDDPDERARCAVMTHPRSGECLGVFPLLWGDAFGGLPIEYPIIGSAGVPNSPPFFVHRRHTAEVFAALFAWLRDSEWRADIAVIHHTRRSPLTMARLRRFAVENHPLPNRTDYAGLLGERFTVALSPIGSILLTGAHYLDKVNAAALSAKKRARSNDRARTTWSGGLCTAERDHRPAPR